MRYRKELLPNGLLSIYDYGCFKAIVETRGFSLSGKESPEHTLVTDCIPIPPRGVEFICHGFTKTQKAFIREC